MSSVIGVDLGGTKVVVACLRGNHMGDSLLHPTDRSGSGALIDQLVAMVNRIRSDDLAPTGGDAGQHRGAGTSGIVEDLDLNRHGRRILWRHGAPDRRWGRAAAPV